MSTSCLRSELNCDIVYFYSFFIISNPNKTSIQWKLKDIICIFIKQTDDTQSSFNLFLGLFYEIFSKASFISVVFA